MTVGRHDVDVIAMTLDADMDTASEDVRHFPADVSRWLRDKNSPFCSEA